MSKGGIHLMPKVSDKFDLEEHRARLDRIIAREKGEKGPLISILHQAQGLYGYLPKELQDYVAEKLKISPTVIYGVVSFYTLFTTKPQGRHRIGLCLGTACYVRGATRILQKLRKELGIDVNETTPDMRYTLEICRCIGNCSEAPAILVDRKIYGRITPSHVMDILERCK